MALLVSLTRRGSILDRVKQVLGRSQDLTPLVAPIRKIMLDANRERALAGIGFDGQRYAPLRPSTLADRARKGYPPGPPLVRQGLNAHVIADCQIQVEVRAGQIRYLKSWPDTPFMQFHIEGTSRMAQRNPAGFSTQELHACRKLVPWHVLGRPI